MRVNWLAVQDFRNYAQPVSSSRPRASRSWWARTARARPTCSKRSAGWPRCRRFGACRTRRLSAKVRPRRSSAPRSSATGGASRSKPRCPAAARPRVLVNGQALRRSRDLLGAVRVSVFSPDDLALIKGGPAQRRNCSTTRWSRCDPHHAETIAAVERVLAPARRVAAPGGRSGNARSGVHARRVGREAGRARRHARDRPAATGGPPRAAYGQGVRRGRRRRGRDRAALRRRRGPTRTTSTSKLRCTPRSPPRAATICVAASRTVGPAPRRTRITHRHAAGADPRVAGRTAVVGAGVATRRPRGGHRDHRSRAGACCSTTCSPSSTRTVRPRCSRACRPVKRCSPPRDRCPTARYPRPRCASPAGGSTTDDLAPAARRATPTAIPHRLGPSLDKVAKRLGAPTAAALSGLFERWEELVGREHRGPRAARLVARAVSCSSRSIRARGPRSCAS